MKRERERERDVIIDDQIVQRAIFSPLYFSRGRVCPPAPLDQLCTHVFFFLLYERADILIAQFKRNCQALMLIRFDQMHWRCACGRGQCVAGTIETQNVQQAVPRAYVGRQWRMRNSIDRISCIIVASCFLHRCSRLPISGGSGRCV